MSTASNEFADLRLDMHWTPPREDRPCRYQMVLTNNTDRTLSDFQFAFCGPGRIDDRLPVDNAILMRRLSNFTEVAMTGKGSLKPGESWTFAFRGLGSQPFRHWSDMARSAYVTLKNGEILRVRIENGINADFPPGVPKLDYDILGDLKDLTDGIAVVPRPAHVAVSGARLGGLLEPAAGAAGSAEAITAFRQVTERLFPGEAFLGKGIRIRFEADAMGEEAYALSFGEEVVVRASGQTGFFYGLVTLGQILRAARMAPDACRFPETGRIEDAPRFSFRGAHIDLARQWYSYDELMDFAAITAWNKLNRLHLHLTEDEAWRMEIAAYPELTEIGAFRGAGLPLPPLLGAPPQRSGGFYTRRQLIDLVAFARHCGMETIPEIDVPGHCYAVLVALPRLKDRGENAEYRSIQGFPNNSLNNAVPEVREFADTVFDELMAVFPGKWIHVGADEVPDDAWLGSPAAKARMAEIGGGVPELQADFLRRLHERIRAAGRITGAWEEGAHGGGIPPEGSYLVAWRDTKIGSELAAKGYDVVMSPGQAYYLDMSRSTDWWEPGASWAGVSSLENTYRYDPLDGFAPEHRGRMIGVQACIWSESMADRRIFQRLVFPRISAIAETGWTPESSRSFARFSAATRFLPRLYDGAFK